MMENQKYGTLIQPSIKLHRQWFREMVKLHGIYVLYRYPLNGKYYTTYAEIDSNFSKPQMIGCLFEDHPTQYTTKKLGWVSELQENASIIHVDYDLENIQIGSLFIVPSGIDDGKGRLFKVIKMSTGIIYPCSISCAIIPEYVDTMTQQEATDSSEHLINVLRSEDLGVMGG